jgi:hypothetical protein
MNMAADGPREGRWRETKSLAQDAGLFFVEKRSKRLSRRAIVDR